MAENIEKIIEKFGGMSAMARALGHKHPTTIQGWRDSGRIPEWRMNEVIEAAQKQGIELMTLANKNIGTPKVLISDKISQTAIDIFKERGVDVDYKPGLTPEQLGDIIGDYDGLAIRSATKVTPEILARATNLKVVGRAGIGVDNVDQVAATNAGVIVMNTPFGNSITTAEHALSMMMSLARQIPQANQSTHAGKWEKSKFSGVELFGKTLGLVGAGNIGAIVADRAQGLKMRVISYDPFLSPKRALELGVEKVEFDDLIKRADFISIHTPLTDSTRNLFNAHVFNQVKPTLRLVNCARGGIINEADLKDALDADKLAGAALDVFADEPAKDNPLFGHEKVICTPHLGASTSEAQENVAIQVAEQIADYLLTGAITNALNTPSVSAEDAPRLKPYLQLSEELGLLIGQIADGEVTKISVEFEGAVGELNTRPLLQSALTGVMRPFYDTVNMVNAPVMAKERGIDVAETKLDRKGAYQSRITIRVEGNGFSTEVAGSLFGGAHPRLLRINETQVEAELNGSILYIVNQDVPGIIGNVGQVLGKHGINIATFHLGRTGDEALSLIRVDGDISNPVKTDLRNLNAVKRVELLNF